MDEMELSPLDACHRALGAKMVPFGGWEMPLSYSAGTLDEHLACRQGAVAFDVSHLGTVQVTGPDALERLQWAFTNDLGKIGPGRAQYTHLLDESDGSVLDDIIIWWVDEETFDVMPNASNTDRVRHAIGGQETTHSRAIIAVQGPHARERLATISPAAAAVKKFRIERIQIGGVPCVVAGTGYTGEEGVEIAVPADAAEGVWQSLLDAGVLPAGLGARDTLRLEAALPLHGHELGAGITPLQAGLGWVVAWMKGDFRGRSALEVEHAQGVERLLRGIVTDGRRPPREGCDVLIDGSRVGSVTSGNFSPVLGHGISLAFLPPKIEMGTAVAIDVRGTLLPGTVVATPFVAKH